MTAARRSLRKLVDRLWAKFAQTWGCSTVTETGFSDFFRHMRQVRIGGRLSCVEIRRRRTCLRDGVRIVVDGRTIYTGPWAGCPTRFQSLYEQFVDDVDAATAELEKELHDAFDIA